MAVFLSYSRRDYYFAESCAFHLEARGVPVWLDVKDLRPGTDWHDSIAEGLRQAEAVVLLASADSLTSQEVRDEWLPALRAGTRIVVARISGGATLPPELAKADVIDLRGSFRRGLDALVARLEQPTVGGDRTSLPGLPRLPPWILLLAVQLGALSVLPIAMADYGEVLRPLPGTNPIALIVSLAVILLLYLWFVWLAFLRRRTGSGRLFGSFLFFVWATAAPLVQGMRGGQATAWFPEATMRWVRSQPEFVVTLLLIAAFGLVVVAVIQPEDLLRWMPTGKAWRRLRVSQPRRPTSARGVAARLQAMSRFRVVADPADRAGADRLRQILRELSIEEAADGHMATTVLLLTNRTQISWLNKEVDPSSHNLLTVVGSNIGLPAPLAWLWRRQWIDLRRWDVRDREAGLPPVPEALTRVQLPIVVSSAHHFVCATAALMFTLAALSQPTDTASAGGSGLGFVCASLALAWGLVARALVNRTITISGLTRWVGVSAIVTVAVGVGALASLASHWSPLHLLPLVFVVATPMWLWRQRRSLGFWLPAGPSTPKVDRLWAGRNWRTTLLFLGYSVGWAALLSPP